jgi:hypothetical protein
MEGAGGSRGAEAEGAEGAGIRTSGETAEGRDPQRLFFLISSRRRPGASALM